MDEFAFHRSLEAIWEFIGVVNRYIDRSQPWNLAKDPARAGQLNRVLATLADALRFLGIVLAPFLPEAAAKIREAVDDRREPRLDNAGVGRINTIPRVTRLSGLFPRVEVRGGGAGAAAPAAVPIGEFTKLDLRVAEVVAAEAVPKSGKLLKLTVSLGGEQRTVVAGIAEHYAPGDLVGKKIVIVANLEPARLMGVESQGMLLAGFAEGRLAVLTPDRDLPPGAKVS
jgi:methionyl-tRNA synthetase